MDIHLDITGFSAVKPVVTIGMFDGVHIGHRSVLEYVRTRAKSLGGQSTVLTFWPHPRICFEGSATKLRYITTLEEKAELIADCGIDHLVLKAFTLDFAKLTPEEYVKSVLVDGLRAHTVIVGYDHNFGYRAEGNFALLQKLGAKYGINVEQLPALSTNGINVSSTKIREAVLSGNISLATTYLGHPYLLTGTVVDGRKLGRTIGFPTANIEINDTMKLIPANGVYVVEAKVKGALQQGVMNIGIKPTVEIFAKQTLEVFLFDFGEDIYGEMVTVRLLKKLRDEIKFASLDELKAQIGKDVDGAKRFFARINLK